MLQVLLDRHQLWTLLQEGEVCLEFDDDIEQVGDYSVKVRMANFKCDYPKKEGVRIEGIGLSTRATNCLLHDRGGSQKSIRTIDDLVGLDDRQLLRRPNMGVKTLKEIRDKLQELGY